MEKSRVLQDNQKNSKKCWQTPNGNDKIRVYQTPNKINSPQDFKSRGENKMKNVITNEKKLSKKEISNSMIKAQENGFEVKNACQAHIANNFEMILYKSSRYETPLEWSHSL